ncbi:hypothetical protein K502DRAFT_362767 [Neoconidiobolus thromboides FSU 785]|nr:hypothetical protein K502DRAFT_362767 [Neoconidiobolus thromboides FSU 785]
MTSHKLDPTSASLLFKRYQTDYLISALIKYRTKLYKFKSNDISKTSPFK